MFEEDLGAVSPALPSSALNTSAPAAAPLFPHGLPPLPPHVDSDDDDDDVEEPAAPGAQRAPVIESQARSNDARVSTPSPSLPGHSNSAMFNAPPRIPAELNTLAYSHLGDLPHEPIIPEAFNSLNLSDDGPPSFLEWLQSQAARTNFSNSVSSTSNDSPSAIARDARSLLTLSKIVHRGRVQAQEIEHVRAMTGGLIQSPLVSQAVRVQDLDLKLRARRQAYIKGAMAADKINLSQIPAGGDIGPASRAPHGRYPPQEAGPPPRPHGPHTHQAPRALQMDHPSSELQRSQAQHSPISPVASSSRLE
ncbi:hypothetical protein PENSPDRAFT_694578 [Peniophora sp. CONT]|nr:hypothetical protein PENSPDRAFT_694578 [Peniophora sp. CONT]